MSLQFQKVSQKDLEKVKKTIKVLSQALTDLGIEYRIFGSIIPTAILGKPQRKLGDIDLMINIADGKKLQERIKKEGYLIKEGKFRFLNLKFVWLEAIGDDLLDLSVFLGRFDKDKNFVINVSKNLKVLAHSQAIKPTVYIFSGVKFIGIPAITGYYGTLASSGNPKRKYDLAVFKAKKIKRPDRDYSVIDFYYLNKRLKFFYSFGCFLQDILGRISLFFGGNYDFWKNDY